MQTGHHSYTSIAYICSISRLRPPMATNATIGSHQSAVLCFLYTHLFFPHSIELEARIAPLYTRPLSTTLTINRVPENCTRRSNIDNTNNTSVPTHAVNDCKVRPRDWDLPTFFLFLPSDAASAACWCVLRFWSFAFLCSPTFSQSNCLLLLSHLSCLSDISSLMVVVLLLLTFAPTGCFLWACCWITYVKLFLDKRPCGDTYDVGRWNLVKIFICMQ